MALKTRTLEKAATEGGDARIEDDLDARGLYWQLFLAVSTDDFDVERSLRNQARIGKPLNEERVETYAEAMKRGDKFPPVVASGRAGKYLMSDGNHRLAAAIRAKKPLDVYHITGEAKAITMYTYEANTKHGLPTTEDERVQHALYLIDSGVKMTEAAAALSVPLALVKRASQKKSTTQRFLDCGIAPIAVEAMAESTKWRLAMISTDEGFRAAVELTQKAALTMDEVFDLVTRLNEIKSSDKQVEFVKSMYDVYTDKIKATGGGKFSGKMRGPKASVSMAMSLLLNIPDDAPRVAGNWTGAEREEAAKRMRASARRLNEIAKALSS